ncbi:hypothetical protein LTR35_017576 [Friedmanniomyces endolithicus]|nr:hypothetical protein LTR35_017576 [Friedmanniomyces endolithicus]KAK0968348.1 hypothetical protein LTR54_018215 [Friedmanniomyces endolithicus]
MSQPTFKDSFTRKYRKGPYSRISPTQPTLSASGKTVLITAGHTGIGFAIASNFAVAGVSHLIIVGRRQNMLEKASEDLSRAHPATKLHIFAASIVDEAAISAVFHKIRQGIAEPDVLVTSAAYFPSSTNVLETPMQQMWASFETNVKGNMHLVQEFLNVTRPSSVSPTNQTPKRDKLILDVSSAATHVFVRKTGIYSASKLAFTRILATAQDEASFLSQYFNLRIHSFHPGIVLTQIGRNNGHNVDTMPWDDVQLPGQFAVWLASPEAEFLKGRFVWANWDVDELLDGKERILKENLLKIGLVGKADWAIALKRNTSKL